MIVGDACAGDSDGDGVPDDEDACPLNKLITRNKLNLNFHFTEEVHLGTRDSHDKHFLYWEKSKVRFNVYCHVTSSFRAAAAIPRS